jgi:hypothetical protein
MYKLTQNKQVLFRPDMDKCVFVIHSHASTDGIPEKYYVVCWTEGVSIIGQENTKPVIECTYRDSLKEAEEDIIRIIEFINCKKSDNHKVLKFS